MFNIAMLKRVFSPKFFLHDICQTGEHEATTRWTMVGTVALRLHLLFFPPLLTLPRGHHALNYGRHGGLTVASLVFPTLLMLATCVCNFLLLSSAGSQLRAMKHACLTQLLCLQ